MARSEPASPYRLRAETDRLLAETDWLRALAGRLVADPATADDAAQDALVAALEHRPRPAGLRAWLRRTLVNRVRAEHRARGHRALREERAARPEAQPSTAELVERAALQRDLAAAVLALAEPYRATILRRFFDGASAREIAAAEGVPLATVQSRVARGLEHLRAALDRRSHGDRAAWVGTLGALRAARSLPNHPGPEGEATSAVNPAAPASAEPAALAGSGSAASVREPAALAGRETAAWAGKGVVAVLTAKSIVAVALAGAAALGGFWLVRPQRSTPTKLAAGPLAEASGAAEAPVEVEARPAPTTTAPERAPASAAAPAPPAAAPPSPGVWLAGRASGTDGPLSVRAGERMSLLVRAVPERESGDLELDLAAAERFAVDLTELFATEPRPSELRLRLDHPRYLPRESALLVPAELATPRAELTAEFELRPALGIVTGTATVPPEHADAPLLAGLFALDENHRPNAVDSALCGPDGTFRLRTPQAGLHVVVAARTLHPLSAGGLRPESRTFEVAADGTALQTTLALDEGFAISGTVRDGTDRATAEVRVHSRLERSDGPAWRLNVGTSSVELAWLDGRFENRGGETSSSTDGSFRLTGLAPALYRVAVQPGSRDALPSDRPWFTPARRRSVTADLLVEAPAEGLDVVHGSLLADLQVVDEAGVPIETWVTVFVNGESAGTSRTDPEGRLAVLADAAQALRLELSAVGYQTTRIDVTPELARERPIRVELPYGPAPAQLVIDLATSGLEHLTGVFASLRSADGPGELPYSAPRLQSSGTHSRLLIEGTPGMVSGERGEAGSIHFSAVPPGRYVAWITPMDRTGTVAYDAVFQLPVRVDLDLAPGSTTTWTLPAATGGRIRLHARTARHTDLRTTLRDVQDERVDVHWVPRALDTGNASGSAPHPGVPCDSHPNLPPGEYTLELRAAGCESRTVTVTVKAGEVTEIEVELPARE